MTRALALVWLLLGASVQAAAPVLLGAQGRGAPREGAVFFLRTGERLVLSQTEAGAEKSARWFHIAPELRAYDNRPGEQARLEPIRYRRTAVTAARSPRLTLSFTTPGTRYFCAGAVTPERFATAKPVQRKYAGRVVQVVVRAGDAYEDFLGELLGTPFVMGPAVARGGWHQTDQRVGSDCASFATYGRRRMGQPVPYAGPVGIVRFLRPLGGPLVPPGADGVYRDARGRRIRTGGDGLRPGDIIHFGAQVAVFHADRGTRGVLDADDLLFQSWRTTPYLTTIRDGGFFDHAIRLYRWRRDDLPAFAENPL